MLTKSDTSVDLSNNNTGHRERRGVLGGVNDVVKRPTIKKIARNWGHLSEKLAKSDKITTHGLADDASDIHWCRTTAGARLSIIRTMTAVLISTPTPKICVLVNPTRKMYVIHGRQRIF